MALIVTAALLGCADDNDDRRFAGEPIPTEERGSALSSPTPRSASRRPSPTATTPLSPEALLQPRGAAEHFFVPADDRLLVFGGERDRPAYTIDLEGRVIAVAASPSGDRAAVLLPAADPRNVEFVLVSAEGQVLRRLDDLDRLLPSAAATPQPTTPAARPTVDWPAQGDRVLVTLPGGGVVAVPVAGEPVLLIGPGAEGSILRAAWSPAGDAIALLRRAGDGATRLELVAVEPSGQVAGVPAILAQTAPGGDGGIVDFTWLPTARGLLFTQATSGADVALGGNLFLVPTRGGSPQLVASAGRAGPTSGIATFLPSPDGRSVAYVIALPGEGAPQFHSLWIQRLGTTNALNLPVPAGDAVTDLWWTAGGLVWRGVPAAGTPGLDYPGGPFALFRATDADGADAFFTAGSLPATPGASPVAASSGAPSATPTD